MFSLAVLSNRDTLSLGHTPVFNKVCEGKSQNHVCDMFRCVKSTQEVGGCCFCALVGKVKLSINKFGFEEVVHKDRKTM